MKQLVKRLVLESATKRGYALIPDWKMASHPLAMHLRELFAHYSIDCVLDVGGNMGQYHDFIREDVRFTGQVVTFEPVSKYVAMLQSKAKSDSKWTVMPHALGATASTAQINVTKSPGLNSFLSPRPDAVAGYWQEDSIVATETVQIKRLDDIFEGLQGSLGFTRPYLKLDTQGFDLEALKGSRGSLRHVRALQTEASVRPLYQGMPSYQEVIEHLRTEGFELSGMFPVSLDKSLRLVEFDCVAINRDYAC